MACLGNHLIIDLYGCDFDEINSEKVISNYLDELVAILKTDIRKKIIYKFEPQGISAAYIISASHMTIHTWPEAGYAGIDIFTCTNSWDKEKIVKHLKKSLQFEKITIEEKVRGNIANEFLDNNV